MSCNDIFGRNVRALFATYQRSLVRAVHVGWLACALLFPMRAWCLSVTFINPGKANEVYWVSVSQVMQAAAFKLGIALEVTYLERDHAKAVEVARDIANRPPARRPDYVLLDNEGGYGPACLRILDGAGIPVLMVFNGVSDLSQRKLSGAPRERYKLWLGTLEPRADDAGYVTAKALIGKARAAAWGRGTVHMLALSGDRLSSSSYLLAQGMRRAVVEAGDVVVDQEVFSGFSREKAAEQMQWLLKRHPQARLVWAANDQTALGAMDAARSHDLRPGQDLLFSGVNTSSEALDALRSGELSAMAGGHFMLGAWALVVVYDHYNGRDFAAAEGLEMTHPMFSLLSPELAARFGQRFGEGRFDAIDFKRFSKFQNPQVKRYNFEFQHLLNRGG
jgi:ABC-type sugar transport system substrate-binding protein